MTAPFFSLICAAIPNRESKFFFMIELEIESKLFVEMKSYKLGIKFGGRIYTETNNPRKFAAYYQDTPT